MFKILEEINAFKKWQLIKSLKPVQFELSSFLILLGAPTSLACFAIQYAPKQPFIALFIYLFKADFAIILIDLAFDRKSSDFVFSFSFYQFLPESKSQLLEGHIVLYLLLFVVSVPPYFWLY